jgi:hypothetical protein
MAFRSSNAANDGKFRRIEVKVNRPGADAVAPRRWEGRPGPTNAAGVNPALGRLIRDATGVGALGGASGQRSVRSYAVALMIDVELPLQAPRSACGRRVFDRTCRGKERPTAGGS